MTPPERRIEELLRFLYGPKTGAETWDTLRSRLIAFRETHPQLRENVPPPEERLTESDAFLITYGDQVTEPRTPPLQTLHKVLHALVRDVITGVHILPFYPYSSDDGFSVIDYKQVHPDLGTWEDIRRLGQDFRLMFDAVINHISRQSAWFQAFLRGEPPYTDYFIVVDPHTDLSRVVRPRATPLLTPVETVTGVKYVWTTFSADQIDLNYHNPHVLLDIIDVLLFYVEQGAEIIRLDAIAYLWKEIGTPCIHLPQTHAVVKLFRAVLDWVAPGVLLITETNVPHEENISYFGDGTDEAQLVYNFALPPLVVHTFRTGDVTQLREWAATLHLPSPTTTFFNFLASHDGIGLMPARGILSDEAIQALVDLTLAHGGHVSYKANPDGSRSVYELNITFYDALNDPAHPQPEVDVNRFLAAQAIMLSLSGVPGIYVHSLFGSRNCHRCVEERGYPRAINREKFTREQLQALLTDPGQHHGAVFQGYRRLLATRRRNRAFHPNAQQTVLDVGRHVLALWRVAPQGDAKVLVLINVTNTPQRIAVPLTVLSPAGTVWQDMLSSCHVVASRGTLTVTLAPYQVVWLTPKEDMSS